MTAIQSSKGRAVLICVAFCGPSLRLNTEPKINIRVYMSSFFLGPVFGVFGFLINLQKSGAAPLKVWNVLSRYIPIEAGQNAGQKGYGRQAPCAEPTVLL